LIYCILTEQKKWTHQLTALESMAHNVV
jgi:hypothetical protein